MKIIFLDIDGVLNTGRWHKKMMESHAPKDSFGYDFDPEAVAQKKKNELKPMNLQLFQRQNYIVFNCIQIKISY